MRWRLQNYIHLNFILVGRVSSVGIATRYGLDGPGIDSRWGHLPQLSSPAPGHTQLPTHGVSGLSRG
jgi:hypothetical protein